MKQTILVAFSFFIVSIASSQFCYPEQITYPHKAPWTIDGNIQDWNLILGPNTGNNLVPYVPQPFSNSSTDQMPNWSIDGFCKQFADAPFPAIDLDAPTGPQSDLRFSSFVTDDYNAFFYLRRMTNEAGAHTVYYFLDVNADGFMNNGEPVAVITFNANKIIHYSLAKFQVNNSMDYVVGKGNYMYSPSTFQVNGYSIKGNLVEILNSRNLSNVSPLNTHEIFDAAVTENGYGLELSIPRQYLINWNSTNAAPLGTNDFLAYHISIQEGAGKYSSDKVLDNIGGCCGALGYIGNPSAQLVSSSAETIVPNLKYRYKITFENTSNVTERIYLMAVSFSNIIAVSGTITNSQINISAVKDYNNNGIADVGEPIINFLNSSLPFSSSEMSVDPGMRVSYIVNVEFQQPVQSFEITLIPTVKFPYVYCIDQQCMGEGGRPINPIGFTETIEDVTMRKPVEENELVPGLLKIFPNPGNGNLTIVLPLSSEDYQVSLSDNLGKRMKVYDRVKASLQINGLQNGVYFLQITNMKTRFTETRKIIVQK